MVFEDRVAKYPNRYVLHYDDGTEQRATLERDDMPTVEGTVINAELMNKLSTVAGALNAKEAAEEAAASASESAGAAATSAKSASEYATNAANSASKAAAIVSTDKTLSISGAPADAKVVGDRFAAKAANSDMTGATSSAAGTHGLVPAPKAGDNAKYLDGSGNWSTPAANVPEATESAAGLMSAEDKYNFGWMRKNTIFGSVQYGNRYAFRCENGMQFVVIYSGSRTAGPFNFPLPFKDTNYACVCDGGRSAGNRSTTSVTLTGCAYDRNAYSIIAWGWYK